MINPEVIKIAQERVRLETAEQIANLHREISAAKSKAAAGGRSLSGQLLNEITHLCVLTIKNRAQLVWQILYRFLTTTGVSYSDSLATELKAMVAEHLPKDMFKNLVRQNAELTGQPKVFEHLGPQLDGARNFALANIGTEIDLFCLNLKQAKETAETGKSETTINVYAPVGAIQTGSGILGSVTQNIDADVREQIAKALKQISKTLNQPDFTMPYPKKDIIEIINEGEVELKKKSPNMIKLGSLLSTIGTAIRTVAALQPAYNTLKFALTYFGIPMP